MQRKQPDPFDAATWARCPHDRPFFNAALTPTTVFLYEEVTFGMPCGGTCGEWRCAASVYEMAGYFLHVCVPTLVGLQIDGNFEDNFEGLLRRVEAGAEMNKADAASTARALRTIEKRVRGVADLRPAAAVTELRKVTAKFAKEFGGGGDFVFALHDGLAQMGSVLIQRECQASMAAAVAYDGDDDKRLLAVWRAAAKRALKSKTLAAQMLSVIVEDKTL